MKNYSDFSKKQSELAREVYGEDGAVASASIIEDLDVDVIKTEVNELEETNTVTAGMTPEVEVFGVVVGCSKLNIREEPDREAGVVTVVAKGTNLKVDMETYDGEWIAVCTASGIQGFCMADYIEIKD